MNTHQNARLTVWGRAEVVRRLLQDREPVALVAAALHVSPPMLYKWRHRFLTEGQVGLLDGCSRPHHSPRCTPRRTILRMLHLRTTRRLTGPEVAAALQLPRATGGGAAPYVVPHCRDQSSLSLLGGLHALCRANLLCPRSRKLQHL